MKTVILMRHSAVDRLPNIDPNDTPLSLRGEMLAQRIFIHKDLQSIRSVYSSPYKRAYDTARMSGRQVFSDPRLVERVWGDPSTMEESFWERQFLDHDFKNTNGESLNEVKARMTSFMNDLLSKINEEETAVAVSHAGAICAYLLNFCTITVLNAQEKTREISFRGNVIHSGKIKTPSAFILEWENGDLINLRYL
ncbi:MAG: histidine phosphatase family protein [Clostridia bacterium]|nr:histidine phosphatase family protein [Clostridia bacterium]